MFADVTGIGCEWTGRIQETPGNHPQSQSRMNPSSGLCKEVFTYEGLIRYIGSTSQGKK